MVHVNRPSAHEGIDESDHALRVGGVVGEADPGSRAAGEGRLRGRLAIGALTMFAAVLWFWDLGSKSLFRDEAFTASTVLRPWGEVFKLSVEHESNGVLHALLLRVLTSFGHSEVMLRSLSVLSLVALVPIIGAIGWRLASPRVGVLASALLVVNGSVAANAQNARTYALSMLIAGLATLLFVLDVEQPRRATVLGWSLCCVLLAYTHIVGVLLVLCHLVSLWFLPRSQRTVRRRVIATAVVLLASLPLAVLITGHNEGRPSQGALRPGAYRDVLFTITGRAGLIGLAAFAIMGFFGFGPRRGLAQRAPRTSAVGACAAAELGCVATADLDRDQPSEPDGHRPLRPFLLAGHPAVRGRGARRCSEHC